MGCLHAVSKDSVYSSPGNDVILSELYTYIHVYTRVHVVVPCIQLLYSASYNIHCTCTYMFACQFCWVIVYISYRVNGHVMLSESADISSIYGVLPGLYPHIV